MYSLLPSLSLDSLRKGPSELEQFEPRSRLVIRYKAPVAHAKVLVLVRADLSGGPPALSARVSSEADPVGPDYGCYLHHWPACPCQTFGVKRVGSFRPGKRSS